MSSKDGVVCPICGGKDVKEIVYGHPDRELLEAVERGDVLLGGGDTDTGPTWACRECHYRWPELPADGPPVPNWVGIEHGWPKLPCPSCGGDGLEIVQCRPAPGVLKAAKEGRIFFAGEGRRALEGPVWHCAACGKEW